jgi:hypothetical protein
VKKRKLSPITGQFLAFRIGLAMIFRLLWRIVTRQQPTVVVWLLSRDRVHIKDVTVASKKMTQALGIHAAPTIQEGVPDA